MNKKSIHKMVVWVVLILLLLPVDGVAQRRRHMDRKYIYVLDITKSMCGFGGAPNILEEVILQMEASIENIRDPHAEIVLSTFQDEILDTWEGKEKIISELNKIKCNDLLVTRTNIYAAWEDAAKNLDADKMNIVFVLTDGAHNSHRNTHTQMLNLVRGWDNNTKDHRVGPYAFLVQLTDLAIDEDVKRVVDATEYVEIIDGVEFFVLLINEPEPIVNIDEGLSFEFDLEKDYWKTEYDDLKLMFELENPYFRLTRSEFTVGEMPVRLELELQGSLDEVKHELPEESTLRIDVSLDNRYPQIKLLDHRLDVRIRNKKEKVLYLKIVE